MRPQVKAQLYKDYAMEDDELRGNCRERLERMCEGLRMLDGEEESDEEGDAGNANDSEY